MEKERSALLPWRVCRLLKRNAESLTEQSAGASAGKGISNACMCRWVVLRIMGPILVIGYMAPNNIYR